MTDREKLEKIKSLADKMYTSMQNLTSDTTPIRKAMDEYKRFIVHEYHNEEPVSEDTPFEPIGITADAVELANIPNKKEPTIPDIVDEHYWEMLGEEPVSNKMGGINNALSQDILAMKSVDLEKEIEIYMGTNLEWDSDALRDPIESWGIKIARHFAAWQKEQDKQWLAENHKHIFAKGRESAEVWISADDDVNNAAEKTTRRFCKISLLSGDYLSLAEAQPQVNKESKLIAIKSFVCGAQWDRNKLMKEAVTAEVRMVEDFMGTTTFRCICDKYKIGDKVKLIILKEE